MSAPLSQRELRRRLFTAWPNARWIFLASGALASAGGNWYLVWFLARSASQDLLGSYALAVSWVLPLFALCGMQLRPLQATESKPEAMADAYRLLRLVGLVLFLSLVIVAAQFTSDGSPLRWLLLLVALPRVAEMLSDYSYGVRTRRSAFREIGASQIIRAVLSMAAFTLCWLLSLSLFKVLLAAGLVALITSLWLDGGEFWNGRASGLHCFPQLRSRRTGRAARQLLVLAAPLTLVAFLNTGVVNLPRILLGRAGLLHEVAILVCLMSLLVIPGLIAAAYSVSLSPRFTRMFASGGIPLLSRELKPAVLRVLAVALPVGVLLLLAGNPVMRIAFGDAYAVDLVTLAAAALFAICWSLSAVLGTAATAARRIAPQLWGFVIAMVSCFGFGRWLVPISGLPGALWSLAIAAALLMCVYLIDLQLALRRAKGGAVGPLASHAFGVTTELPTQAERSVANVCRS